MFRRFLLRHARRRRPRLEETAARRSLAVALSASFPTARDPRQQDPQSFDYLVPGRMLLVTFRPIRFQADVPAQTEFRAVLRDAREDFRDQIELALQVLDWLQQRSAPTEPSGAGPTASTSSPPG